MTTGELSAEPDSSWRAPIPSTSTTRRCAFGLGPMGRTALTAPTLNFGSPMTWPSSNVESSFTFDSRFGLMVFGEFYQFGLAVSNLLQSPFKLIRNRPIPQPRRAHCAFTARYDYRIDGDWTVQPAAMLRFTEITPSSGSARPGLLPEPVLGRPRCRQGDAFVISAGAVFQDLQVGTMMPEPGESATSARTRTKSPYLTYCPAGVPVSRAAGWRPHPRSESHHPQLTSMIARLSFLVFLMASLGSAEAQFKSSSSRKSTTRVQSPAAPIASMRRWRPKAMSSMRSSARARIVRSLQHGSVLPARAGRKQRQRVATFRCTDHRWPEV